MRCSNCGKETPFTGKVCHWCNNDKSKDQKTHSIAFVVVIILFFLIWKCSCSESNEDRQQGFEQQTTENETNQKITALTAAQECVKERLKSPSSADFPWGTDCVSKVSENTYIINSYVDSQNSFGAMLRTNFSCQVTLNSDDTYTCDNVELLEQ